MIPNTNTGLKTTGTLPGEAGRMTIDQNNMSHIMSILIDLYSDPELAVVREYATNALDSHIEAGVARPIEVSTPTSLSGFYTIRDFGVGMSIDDIKKYYTSYGGSTKRESNEVVGMLGLGSKSALTYTKQFTVIAVKNGVKSSVMISRLDTGEGTYQVMDTRGTDEPNGVTIQIPVKSLNSFAQKAEHFFSFWEPGTVLLNGVQPKSFFSDKFVTKVDENLSVYTSDSYSHNRKSYLVMGNVPYEIENFTNKHVANYRLRSYGVVHYVPIGSVAFTPNREALHYTPLTESQISATAKAMHAGIEDAALKSILEADNLREAYKMWTKWRAVFDNIMDGRTYKGIKLVDNIDWSGQSWSPYAHRYSVDNSVTKISTDVAFGMTVVVNKPVDAVLSAGMKRKIKRHFELKNESHPRIIYLGDKAPDTPFTKNITVLDWNAVAAIKLQTPTTSGNFTPRVKGTWDFYTYEVKTNQIKRHYEKPLPANSDLLLFISPAENGDSGDKIRVHPALTYLSENATMVMVARNRQDKFVRDNPAAKPFVKHMETCVKALADAVDPDVLAFKSMRYDYIQKLEILSKYPTMDPDIKKHVGLVQKGSSNGALDKLDRAIKLARLIHVASPAQPQFAVPSDLLAERYPLTRFNNITEINHSVKYINMIFKENNK